MIDPPTLLANPLCIQNVMISDLQKRITGDLVLVDANNSFAFLMEAFSRIVADATNANDRKLNALYAARANTTEDLYNHLSDFDYVGFFSNPASLNLTLMLNKDYLIQNAVAVPGTNYQMVVIPADTIFTVGRFTLGLYYPIQIIINSAVGTISAQWDASIPNPLYSLSTNTIPIANNHFEGVDLVEIQFTCWQFNKVVTTESINPDIGYTKNYSYDNLFYAVRVFDTSSDTPKELSQTLSESIYDIDVPTVYLQVFPETNSINLSIPQIYFTSGLIGRQLKIEIYSTLGSLNASLVNVQLSEVVANFAMSSPNTDMTYTDILRTIQTIIIAPAETNIIGGSNSLTFEQIKNATIYRDNSAKTPTTRMDLEQFFTKNGFDYMLKIDNLTDRRYYAYTKVLDGVNEIGTSYGPVTLNFNQGTPSRNVLYQNNGSIVILPTAIYNYVTDTKSLALLTDAQADQLTGASGENLVNMLNSNGYFVTPHHIVVTTLDDYPDCEIFDLMTTTAQNTTFIDENPYLSAQLSLITIGIQHLNNGSGGYVVRAGFQRSDDLASADGATDLMTFLTVLTHEGFKIGLAGKYVGTVNGLDVYDFTITTSYKITDTTISVTNMTVLNASPLEYFMNLTGTMYISTFVRSSLYPTVGQDLNIIPYLMNNDGTWLGISLQSFTYTLGSNISDVIDPNLITNWTNQTYQTYPVAVPQTYQHDVYQTNANGTIVYTVGANGSIITTKLHSAGDPVLDGTGNPVIRHSVGDIVLDASGNPIPIAPSVLDFTIFLSVYDYGRLVINPNFMRNIAADLSAYFATIRTMNQSVLEKTEIYFNPIVTTGIGTYKINNTTTIKSALGLSFVFNCYVSQATLDDPTTISSLTSQIIAITASHLSDEVISMTVIAADIKNQLSSYINSFDIVSLNGSSTIQTLMNVTVDSAPIIGMTMTVGSDGVLTYMPEIDINYMALDL